MADISGQIYKMRFLDEQSCRNTVLHDLHPLSKLLVTILYLVTVTSFGKYSLTSLLPLIFYPVVAVSLAEIPLGPLVKRVLPTIPFVAGVGIFNPVFDRSIQISVGGVGVTGGWISFAVLLTKCILLVLSALILIATTGMDGTAAALRVLRVPKLFVLQILLTYRYISVLADEAGRIWSAYSLRAPGQKGVRFSAWGSFAGQLLLRTFDRAQRVYHAMEMRGFRGEYHSGKARPFRTADALYAAGWTAFFVLTRFVDIPAFFGTLLTGGK